MNPVFLALVLALTGALPARVDGDPVLYHVTGQSVTDGRSGKIIVLQRAMNRALESCGRTLRIAEDGAFGPGSAGAVRELAACTTIAERLPDGSPAFEGAVTEAFWQAVAPDEAAPTLAERIRALLLAFEATDYTRAEWNFCQNRPFYDPPDSGICVSNDPRSYLTWGPNGATAGHGQEVQAILTMVDRDDPMLLDSAFAGEAEAVRKLLAIRKDDVERYLCSVWLNRSRRQSWRQGFAALGGSELTRRTYDDVYASISFDGGKIHSFHEAWAQAGLRPTETDHAFFIDRSAHTSVRTADLVAALRAAQAASAQPLPAWAARRAVALGVPPANVAVRRDRLGRDVTFYIDGAGVELSAAEREAWELRGRRRASNVGLSDERAAPAFAAGAPVDWRPATFVPLTREERSACPEAVLNPRSP